MICLFFYFFWKIYCAAALMLAFKIREYDHYRMKPIIMSYFHCAPRKEFGKIMNDQVYSNIKNKVRKENIILLFIIILII